MPDFRNIAPYLDNELVVAGFGLFLVVGLMKLTLSLKIFRKLTSEHTHSVVMRVVTYGFILALCGLLGGFGLAYYRASLESERGLSDSTHDGGQIAPLKEPSRVNPQAKNGAELRVTRILEETQNRVSVGCLILLLRIRDLDKSHWIRGRWSGNTFRVPWRAWHTPR